MAVKGHGNAYTLWNPKGAVVKVAIVRENGAGIRTKSAKGSGWRMLYKRELKADLREIADRLGCDAVYQELVRRGDSGAGFVWRPGEPPRDAKWTRESVNLERCRRIMADGFDDTSCEHGCRIEPDATCEHGVKSYLLRHGMI